MFLSSENIHMWVWATQHPYLFTLIKISTPTVMVLFMYLASKIMFKVTGKK